MPVLISGFCTAITESTGYFDMNYIVLAKIDKISFTYLNHTKGPIELSALMAFCFLLPASCINRKSLFLVLFNPYIIITPFQENMGGKGFVKEMMIKHIRLISCRK